VQARLRASHRTDVSLEQAFAGAVLVHVAVGLRDEQRVPARAVRRHAHLRHRVGQQLPTAGNTGAVFRATATGGADQWLYVVYGAGEAVVNGEGHPLRGGRCC
jgi:hypothetical protein